MRTVCQGCEKKVVLFFALVLFCLAGQFFPQMALAQTENVLDYKHAVVLETADFDQTQPTEVKMQKVNVKFLDEKNNISVWFDNNPTFSVINDRRINKGDKIIVSYQVVDGQEKVSLVDFDRSLQLLILVLICIGLVLVIGLWTGIKSLISFSWIGLILFGWLLPGILRGSNVFFLVTVAIVLIVIGTSVLLMGFSRKMLLVTASSLFGVLVATLLTLLFGWWSRYSPSGQEDLSLFRISPVLSKLNLLDIIYASIMIGGVGSMMDMTISIVAGIEETIITAQTKGIGRLDSKELFLTGLNIGRSVMAAETNTMVLAYFGSALTLWLVALSQNYTWGLLISFGMVFGELLRILAVAVGIFSSIPMTAFLASKLLIYNRKHGFE
ncbi:MAG: YibE/F family protein [Patescibacteria group bacterium]